jgi:hypothetical protein
MNLIPEGAIQTEITGATVPFYRYEIDGQKYLQFDSSLCGHPEPMINAMSGLQNLADDEKLIMINSKAPMGLFPKIEADFSNEVEELSDSKFKITFTKKSASSNNTNFNDTACNG